MRLTIHTDYAIRTLIYLAMNQNKLVTISDVSQQYQISKNHLMKVAQELVHHKFVISERGRNGGLRLARLPSDINLGDVIEKMEPDFNLVACFDCQTNTCKITNACGAQAILMEARDAFLTILKKYSLDDALASTRTLEMLFSININDESLCASS